MRTTKTDAELQADVIRELQWDTHVDAASIGVTVAKAIVTLTGTVASWGARHAAQQAAHRVRGVLDVANEIEVKRVGTPMHSDTALADIVRAALEWDVFVPEKRIRTTVTDGRVTLEGDVETWRQRESAEAAIRNLAGVHSIVNRIEIHAAKDVTSDVQRAIESALARHAERDARAVRIALDGSNVTVSGTVHSWREREIVLGAVKGTRGVRAVTSQLVVEP